MEFHTFYDYFLYTKSWAYVMMFVVLPLYVLYWNFVLFPDKKKGNNSPKSVSYTHLTLPTKA